MEATPTVAPRETPARAGRLTLVHPTRAYAMSRNPFVIPAILPLIVLSFVGLDVAIQLGADPTVSCAAFLVVTTGLLLISALNLRGSLTITHDGILFERGRQQLTAGWGQVTGLSVRPNCGLCVDIMNPDMTDDKISMPGGLGASRGGLAHIPLRIFGDRYISIVYDLRERLQERQWGDAIAKSAKDSSRLRLWMALATAYAAVAMFVTLYLVTH